MQHDDGRRLIRHRADHCGIRDLRRGGEEAGGRSVVMSYLSPSFRDRSQRELIRNLDVVFADRDSGFDACASPEMTGHDG